MKRNQELNTMYEDTCVKVYDPEQQKLIGVFKNYAKAANKLGVSSNVIHQRCVSKNRVYSPVLQKKVAIRLSSVKPEDMPHIERNQLID